MTVVKITKESFITEDGEEIFFDSTLDEVPDLEQFNEWLQKVENAITSPFTFEEIRPASICEREFTHSRR